MAKREKKKARENDKKKFVNSGRIQYITRIEYYDTDMDQRTVCKLRFFNKFSAKMKSCSGAL